MVREIKLIDADALLDAIRHKKETFFLYGNSRARYSARYKEGYEDALLAVMSMIHQEKEFRRKYAQESDL